MHIPENELTIEHKARIRTLLLDKYGYQGDLPPTYDVPPTRFEFIEIFNQWCLQYPEFSKFLNGITLNNLGPSEVLLYFIFNQIELGGNQTSIDLSCDGVPFAEVKSVQVNRTKTEYTDFRFGTHGDFAATKFINGLAAYAKRFSELVGTFPSRYNPNSPTEVCTSVCRELRTTTPLSVLEAHNPSINAQINLISRSH